MLTKSLEFRILYTQKLDYGHYNAKTFTLESFTKKLHQDEVQVKKQQGYLVDEGIIVSSLQASPSGDYSQSACAHSGQMVLLGFAGLTRYTHLGWDESLEAFKLISKGNWIQDFTRAIEIYTGQVKGFKDVPEDQEMRQQQMKGQLKLFIRTVITDQLERWNEERDALEDSQKQAPGDNPYASRGSEALVAQDKQSLDDSNAEILQQLEA